MRTVLEPAGLWVGGGDTSPSGDFAALQRRSHDVWDIMVVTQQSTDPPTGSLLYIRHHIITGPTTSLATRCHKSFCSTEELCRAEVHLFPRPDARKCGVQEDTVWKASWGLWVSTAPGVACNVWTMSGTNPVFWGFCFIMTSSSPRREVHCTMMRTLPEQVPDAQVWSSGCSG